MTQFFCGFVDESKTWFNGSNIFMACHAFLLSLTLNSFVNHQKVSRDTVYQHKKKSLCTQGNPVSTQKVLTLSQPFQSN